MGRVVHNQLTTVWVQVNVDVGIADLVRYLNTIPGVRTTDCCQGTIGEGGPEPYGPYVGVTWTDDAILVRLQSEFDVGIEGSNWGTVHPRP